jgi:hypothetical protein
MARNGGQVTSEVFLAHQWDAAELWPVHMTKLAETPFDYIATEDRVEPVHAAFLDRGMALLGDVDELITAAEVSWSKVLWAIASHGLSNMRAAYVAALPVPLREQAIALVVAAAEELSQCSGRHAAAALIASASLPADAFYSMNQFTDASEECLCNLALVLAGFSGLVKPGTWPDDAGATIVRIAQRVAAVHDEFYAEDNRPNHDDNADELEEDFDDELREAKDKREGSSSKAKRHRGTRVMGGRLASASSDLKAEVGDGHWMGRRLMRRQGAKAVLALLSGWKSVGDLFTLG